MLSSIFVKSSAGSNLLTTLPFLSTKNLVISMSGVTLIIAILHFPSHKFDKPIKIKGSFIKPYNLHVIKVYF